MGNTSATSVLAPRSRDHPHVYGEYYTSQQLTMLVAGSPPTYMGNTRKAPVPGPKDWDHPHVYGEYTTISPLRLCWIGSPPRIWGIQVVSFGNGLVGGITPTYMGNTRTRIKLFLAYEDHPHVYGEYYYNLWHTSSPPRITPTYMGNTELSPVIIVIALDHPHVYGEYTKRLPANQAFAPSIPQFLFSLLI